MSWPPGNGLNDAKLLRAPNNLAIVEAMSATTFFSALFLILSGTLLARRTLRAKGLPLLRRAR